MKQQETKNKDKKEKLDKLLPLQQSATQQNKAHKLHKTIIKASAPQTTPTLPNSKELRNP